MNLVGGELTDVETRVCALEARLTLMEDEKAIRELLSRYGYFADAGRDDDFIDLFSDDCVMDVTPFSATASGEATSWQGKDALRVFLRERTALHGDGFVGRSFHVQGNNLAVRINDHSAVATGYSFILQQGESDVRLISASTNVWHLRKINDRWHIRERVRRGAGAADLADLSGDAPETELDGVRNLR